MLASFSPSDVIMTINDYRLEDFASGSFIEINQNSQRFRPARGIRGKHTRIHTRDRSGTVVFRLMQTSKQNTILSKLANEDDLNMTGLLLVNIVDVGSDTGVQFGNAYLEGLPNLSFQSDSTTPKEWRINFEFITRYDVGGNQKAPLDFLSNVF